jgi:hypothetical protein
MDHLRDGTYRPARHGRRGGAARKIIRAPEPPAGAPALFKQVWRDTAAVVDPLRIMTEADVPAFKLMVEALSICADAYDRIYKGAKPGLNALVYEKPLREGVQRTKTPEVDILIQFQKLAAFHLSRWGLTPADRARVDGAAPDDMPGSAGADPVDEFTQ